MSEFLTQFMERRGELLELTIEHMEMTSLAVLASLIVGGLIGIAITKNDKAAAIVIGIANLMQSIPSIGLLAFMVPFVGIGQKPAIIMVVIYALLPIIKNTYTGITGIDPKLLEAASGIGLSKTQQLLRIQLPLALPFIMAGIRISAVTAVGTVTIAAVKATDADKAKKMIEAIVKEPEPGEIYYGKVVRLMNFGAFVNLLPGKDGMVHISKMADHRIEKVEDAVKEGDMVWVKVMEIDDKGRVNLSMKDVKPEEKIL